MQLFNECRNRVSPIQRFSSTRMRCMTAVWPAGPPELKQQCAPISKPLRRIEWEQASGARRAYLLK